MRRDMKVFIILWCLVMILPVLMMSSLLGTEQVNINKYTYEQTVTTVDIWYVLLYPLCSCAVLFFVYLGRVDDAKT